jgi:hypothetical protein
MTKHLTAIIERKGDGYVALVPPLAVLPKPLCSEWTSR